MFTQAQLAQLSVPKRKVIVRHVAADGPLPFSIGNPDAVCIRSLITWKILRPHPQVHPMRATVLTNLGREVACMVLAEYADALIAAGAGRTPLEDLLEQKTPVERLEEIKKITQGRTEHLPNLAQVTENIAEDGAVALPHQ